MAIAYVLITCDLGFEEAVIENLKHFESVKEAQGTFGAYDIISKVENIEQEKIQEITDYCIRN